MLMESIPSKTLFSRVILAFYFQAFVSVTSNIGYF